MDRKPESERHQAVNKMKLAISVLLMFLVITSCNFDGRMVEADNFVCDILFELCLPSCGRSGSCMRCCKHHGFVHGRCSLKHGDGCCCCHTPDPDHTAPGLLA